MEVNKQHHELCSLIRREILYPWRRLTIGVDGRDGVGKSVLSRYLAWDLDLPTIETDMFIISDDQPPSYRYEDLGRLIESRHTLDRPVIVEGVFLLHMLAKLNVKCDFLIYVENEEQISSNYLEERLKEYDNDYDPKGAANYILEWCVDR